MSAASIFNSWIGLGSHSAKSIILVGSSLLVTAPVVAKGAPMQMLKELCGKAENRNENQVSGKEPVSKDRILAAAMAQSPQRIDLFDTNRDGAIAREEMIGALIDPVAHCKASGACRTGEQANLQKIADTELSAAMFNDAVTLSPTESRITVAQLLSGNGSVSCKADAIQLAVEQKNRTVFLAGAKTPRDALAPEIAFRTPESVLRETEPTDPASPATIEEKRQKRKEEVRKTVAGGEVTFTRDFVSRTTNIDAELAVGPGFALGPTLLALPYVQLMATSTQIDNAERVKKLAAGEEVEDDKRVVNLTPGLAVTRVGGKVTLDLISGFVFDLVEGARIASFEIGIAPTFNYPPLGLAGNFGSKAEDGRCWKYYVGARLIFLANFVVDSGSNATLAEGGNVLRTGPDVFGILKYQCGEILKGIQLNVSYRHLMRIDGPGPNDFGMLDTSLSLPLRDSRVKLKFGYQNGVDQDTLKHINTLTSGVEINF